MTTPAIARHQLSYRHQKVQRLRRLVRRRALREAEQVFVVEGGKLVVEALDSGLAVESLFVAPQAWQSDVDAALASRALGEGLRVHELEPGVMERVADTVAPQPVLAVVGMPRHDIGMLAECTTVVVLVDVRDPGNAGTILRSAEASGVGGVVFCDGSVDVFNPKTVRSSAGSIFHVPVVNQGSATDALAALRAAGFQCAGTAMHDGTDYDRADLTRKMALVFGNEANGLPTDLQATLDEMLTIPIEGRSESLNVSMAASVLCFEVARQRRAGADSARSAIAGGHEEGAQ